MKNLIKYLLICGTSVLLFNACTESTGYGVYNWTLTCGIFNNTTSESFSVAGGSHSVSTTITTQSSTSTSSSGGSKRVHVGDRLTIFYSHSGTKINSSSVEVYIKFCDKSVPLERKTDYDLVLSSVSAGGEGSSSSTTVTKHYDVIYIAEFVVPSIPTDSYLFTYSATDGDVTLDKGYTYIDIIGNED